MKQHNVYKINLNLSVLTCNILTKTTGLATYLMLLAPILSLTILFHIQTYMCLNK